MKFSFLVLLLLTHIRTSLIVPDLTRPIIFSSNDSQTLNKEIQFKFKLGDSVGIPHRHFVHIDMSRAGLVFRQRKGQIDSSGLERTAEIDYTCSLSDSSGAVFQTVSLDSNDTAVLSCQLVDLRKSAIFPPHSWVVLTIKLLFSSELPIITDSVKIVTSPSNINSLVTNSNYSFTAFATYNSFANLPTSSVPLLITSFAVQVTGGSAEIEASSNFINYGDTFDVNITCLVNKWIPKDFFFEFHYDSTLFEGTSEISSKAISGAGTNYLKFALNGSLALEQKSPGVLLLKGLIEDLVVGRNFQLSIKGMKAKYRWTNKTFFKMVVMYKNTNTVFSSSENTENFSIKKANLNISSISNPDGYEYVVSAMSWPFRFSIKPNVPLSNIFLVVTTERLANEAYLRFNASTCEFLLSNNTFTSGLFCHPYVRHDELGIVVENGIIAKVDALSNIAELSFTVWGYISKCDSVTGVTPVNYKIRAYSNIQNAQVPVFEEIFELANSGKKTITNCLQNQNLVKISTKTCLTNLTTETQGSVFLVAVELNEIRLHKTAAKTFIDPNFGFLAAPTNIGAGTLSYTFNADHLKLFQSSELKYLFSTTVNTNEPFLISGKSPFDCDYNFPLAPMYSTVSGVSPQSTFLTNSFTQINFRKKWFLGGTYRKNKDQTTTTTFDTTKTPIERCFVQWILDKSSNTTTKAVSFIPKLSSATNFGLTEIVSHLENLRTSPKTETGNLLYINYLMETKEVADDLINHTMTNLPISDQNDNYSHYKITGILTSNTYSVSTRRMLVQENYTGTYNFGALRG